LDAKLGTVLKREGLEILDQLLKKPRREIIVPLPALKVALAVRLARGFKHLSRQKRTRPMPCSPQTFVDDYLRLRPALAAHRGKPVGGARFVEQTLAAAGRPCNRID
jgi:hypothetical protein